MEIRLRAETTEKISKITLTQDSLENDNFIELIIEDKEYMISLDDLYFALKMFYDKRSE